MDEKPDQIMKDIEAQRNQLGQNLNELENKVRRSADWKTYFEKNPMLILGAAMGGGLLLGAVAGGRSSHRAKHSVKSGSSSGKKWRSSGSESTPQGLYTPASSYTSPLSESTSGGAAASSHFAGSFAPSTLLGAHMSQVSEAMDHMKGALVAFGISKMKEFLSQAVPGLDQHLGEAANKTGTSPGSTSSSFGSGGANDYRSGSQQTSEAPGSQTQGEPAGTPSVSSS